MIYLGVLPAQIITAGYGEPSGEANENSATDLSKQRRVDWYFNS